MGEDVAVKGINAVMGLSEAVFAASSLLAVAEEDAKEPGTDTAAALKTFKAADKGKPGILSDFLGDVTPVDD